MNVNIFGYHTILYPARFGFVTKVEWTLALLAVATIGFVIALRGLALMPPEARDFKAQLRRLWNDGAFSKTDELGALGVGVVFIAIAALLACNILVPAWMAK
jgi:hypothetical protein